MSRRKQYHHGDLRAALISEGTLLLAESGPESFSLSQLARRIGVSNAAPYRHFADRDTLIDAIADEGYVVFNNALQAAVAAAPDAGQAITGIIRAYLEFATHFPTQFAVMFKDREGRPHDVGPASFATFANAVVAAQQAGYLDDTLDPRAVARPLWSAVHGAAVLEASGAFSKLDLDVPREELIADLMRPFLREPPSGP